MPLHEWNDRMGWDGIHLTWLVELLRSIKSQLPAGYRVYLGTPPPAGIDAVSVSPDVLVRDRYEWMEIPRPDIEVAIASLDTAPALHVVFHGQLIAALEVIPPRDKDRPARRDSSLARYLGYLLQGAHLLLVDVHRRPLGFSFADQIAVELQLDRPHCPSPLAACYRVGEPAATGGRLLALW